MLIKKNINSINRRLVAQYCCGDGHLSYSLRSLPSYLISMSAAMMMMATTTIASIGRAINRDFDNHPMTSGHLPSYATY